MLKLLLLLLSLISPSTTFTRHTSTYSDFTFLSLPLGRLCHAKRIQFACSLLLLLCFSIRCNFCWLLTKKKSRFVSFFFRVWLYVETWMFLIRERFLFKFFLSTRTLNSSVGLVCKCCYVEEKQIRWLKPLAICWIISRVQTDNSTLTLEIRGNISESSYPIR